MRKVVFIVLGIGIVIALSFILVNNQQSTETSNVSESNNSQLTEYTIEDVALHASANDCWTIINGTVYDLTGYITQHPGGDTVTLACGKDGTTLFTQRKTENGALVGSGTPHSQSANQQLAEYAIGTLAP